MKIYIKELERLEHNKRKILLENLLMISRGFCKYALKHFNVKGRTRIFKLWDWFEMSGLNKYAVLDQDNKELHKSKNKLERQAALDVLLDYAGINEWLSLFFNYEAIYLPNLLKNIKELTDTNKLSMEFTNENL